MPGRLHADEREVETGNQHPCFWPAPTLLPFAATSGAEKARSLFATVLLLEWFKQMSRFLNMVKKGLSVLYGHLGEA
jgi:hypothetical protein